MIYEGFIINLISSVAVEGLDVALLHALFASTMQACKIRRRCLTISTNSVPDSSAMSDGSASPIRDSNNSLDVSDNDVNDNGGRKAVVSPVVVVSRNHRPSRACTVRAATRLYGSNPQQMSKGKQQQQQQVMKKDDDDEDDELLEVLQQQKFSSGGTGSSRVVSQLVNSSPEPSQLPRWNLRGMWELASVLNFLHVGVLIKFLVICFSGWMLNVFALMV